VPPRRPRNTEHSMPPVLSVKENSHSGTRPEKKTRPPRPLPTPFMLQKNLVSHPLASGPRAGLTLRASSRPQVRLLCRVLRLLFSEFSFFLHSRSSSPRTPLPEPFTARSSIFTTCGFPGRLSRSSTPPPESVTQPPPMLKAASPSIFCRPVTTRPGLSPQECRRKSLHNFTSTSAPPPNSNSAAP
jgi:hypothetical protein